ncbi:MAG: hypothetical protein HPY72_11275 [Anaerolineae bacterium]|nr:hypothetical protein [Anaerolineae bacterium]
MTENQEIPAENMPAVKNKTAAIILAIVAVILLVGVIFGIVVLSKQNADTTGRVRDIFIIVLALESLLLGVALVILVIQLAVLTNLIQNEVKPILASTKEAVSTIKGTSKFISDRAVKPIITASSFMAGSRKLFEIIGFIKRKE